MKARHLYETLGFPSNANFETVLRAGGIGSWTLTADDAKVAYKIWGDSVPRLKGSTVCLRDWSTQASEFGESPLGASSAPAEGLHWHRYLLCQWTYLLYEV